MAEIADGYNAVNTDCIVATDGTAGGNGTLASPLSWAAVKLLYDTLWPGVAIKFRGGTYAMDESVNFSGNPYGYLTLSGYPGEIVKINGSIWLERDYCILRDMEIYDGDFTDRDTFQTGSNPSDIPQRDASRAEAGHAKLIGLILHDTRQGGITNTIVTNIEITDCIIFYNGWSAPDRGHGHGTYSGTVTIRNCIVFENFGYGLHGYLGGDQIIYENCVVFGNGELNNSPQCNILVGGTATATNFRVSNCQTYYSSLVAGLEQFIGLGNGGVIENNIFVTPIIRIDVANTNTQISGNKFYGSLMNFTAEAYPDNVYSTTRPETGTDVVVHPSDNYTGRVYVAIYNWTQADSVSVDLSTVAGLSAGDDVTVTNVQDLFVDIATLTLDANKCISVDMRAISHTVATPQGWTAPATTFPQFGCFVLEKA